MSNLQNGLEKFLQVFKNFNYSTKFDKKLQQKSDKVYKIGQNRAKSVQIGQNLSKSGKIGRKLYRYINVNPYKKK